MRQLVCSLATAAFVSVASFAVAAEGPDYLGIVRAYADAMIDHGQDVYGAQSSPLFAEALDRRTMRLPEGDVLKRIAAIPRETWGIRPHDRMIAGGNPQHCQNLYQVLYALTTITGEKRYAQQADRSLAFSFAQCQSPATGLLYWGEHAGWDFRTEQPIKKSAGTIHEFYRPWVLWKRSWQLAPDACRRYALGLWEHQIGNHQTGDYSRHARIDAHGPGTEAPYARHGGFYIETWAIAYEKTGDKVFLSAIESIVDGLERARLEEGGMLVGGSKRRGGRRAYDVSLAISLDNAASKVTSTLAEKMRRVAVTNDQVFAQAHPDPGPQRAAPASSTKNLWSNAYGGSGPAGAADACMLRYRQVGGDAYRGYVLRTAQRYRDLPVNLSTPVWPGTMGNVVFLMLNAHELSGEGQYLDAADRFAHRGIELFLSDDCPLPKASHAHDHYEAVTNGDTLMMALLKLWQIRRRPELKLKLIFCDR